MNAAMSTSVTDSFNLFLRKKNIVSNARCTSLYPGVYNPVNLFIFFASRKSHHQLPSVGLFRRRRKRNCEKFIFFSATKETGRKKNVGKEFFLFRKDVSFATNATKENPTLNPSVERASSNGESGREKKGKNCCCSKWGNGKNVFVVVPGSLLLLHLTTQWKNVFAILHAHAAVPSAAWSVRFAKCRSINVLRWQKCVTVCHGIVCLCLCTRREKQNSFVFSCVLFFLHLTFSFAAFQRRRKKPVFTTLDVDNF